MTGVVKFYIMKLMEKISKRFNLMEHSKIEMKSGVHSQPSIVGPCKVCGHNFLEDQM